jgi:hypothetical protein
MKNTQNKMRTSDAPYEIWQSFDGSWTWLVLKKWQGDDNAPYARWFCQVFSPMTYGSYDVSTGKAEGGSDMGDCYVSEIKSVAVKVK